MVRYFMVVSLTHAFAFVAGYVFVFGVCDAFVFEGVEVPVFSGAVLFVHFLFEALHGGSYAGLAEFVAVAADD